VASGLRQPTSSAEYPRKFAPLSQATQDPHLFWYSIFLFGLIIIAVGIAIVITRRRKQNSSQQEAARRKRILQRVATAHRTAPPAQDAAFIIDSRPGVREQKPAEQSQGAEAIVAAIAASESETSLSSLAAEEEVPETPPIPTTANLQIGQTVFLHFAGTVGSFPGRVSRVEPSSTLVKIDQRLNLVIQPGHAVEGLFLHHGHNYWFETAVRQCQQQNGFECRLQHAKNVSEYFPHDKVKLREPSSLQFRHYQCYGRSPETMSLAALRKLPSADFDGTLLELSRDGCTIRTGTPFFEIHDALLLRFQVLQDEPQHGILAIVRGIHDRHQNQGGGVEMDLSFFRQDEAAALSLERTIALLQNRKDCSSSSIRRLDPSMIPGTRAFFPGVQIGVHFHNIVGSFSFPIEHMRESGFSIPLGKRPGARQLELGGRHGITCFFSDGRNLQIYETHLAHPYQSGDADCWIVHCDDLRMMEVASLIKMPRPHAIQLQSIPGRHAALGEVPDFTHLPKEIVSSHEAEIREIGCSRLRLYLADRNLYVGDCIQFDLQILADEPLITIRATVSRVTPAPSSSGEGLYAEIEILNLTPDHQVSLDRTVFMLQNRGKEKQNVRKP